MAAWCAENLRDLEGWKACGLELTTPSNECAKLFDGALRQIVSWSDCELLGGFLKTLDDMKAADPKAVLPRAFRLGLEGLGTGTCTRVNEVFKNNLVAVCADAQSYGNPREQKHARAVRLWGEGKKREATNIWEEILLEYPTDLVAIKFAHDAYFFMGDGAGKRDSVAAALELNRFDCWATHARAHVMLMNGRVDEGIRFMESTVDDWRPGWIIATHNYWHNAVFHLEKGNSEAALTIFEDEVCRRANKSGSVLDFADAASMLWRMELDGVDVGKRQCDEDNVKVSKEVGLAVCEGMALYGRGKYEEAAKRLLPVRHEIYRIGGSNAQGWRSSKLPLSTPSNECAKLLDAAVRQFVSWSDCEKLNGLDETLRAMSAADENAVLPRAFALGLEAIGTGVGARTNATFREQLEKLQVDAAKYGNERERKHAKAVQQFAEGKQSAAAHTWEEILKEHPTDLIAIKFAHDTYFYLGDAKMIRDSVQAVLPKHSGSEPCYRYSWAVCLFLALEANRFDCWATHAKAHVLEMQGRFKEGIHFLESTVDDWKLGNHEVPLSIFDREILPRALKSGAMLDIVDTVSMLWRLELEGVNVGDRWRKLPDLRTHVDDHVLFFNDIHMGETFNNSIALQRGHYVDDEQMIHRTLLDFAHSDEYDQARICRDVGITIYKAMSQYSRAEYDDCVKSIYPIRDKIYTIGGSNAQRDLFTQTLIHACIESSQKENFSLAPKLLEERDSRKKNSLINERLAAEFRKRHPI
ncbi:unnamed protein product [Nippostrongylus brasiliensis]|uniref:Tetratricopeptide repeat protein 38 n=1 Tax=Nippostrongylus brasiliensis TaxID=27835 RepID=A0A0N4XYJ3_NIPBR|nr:unnamed protein product [Nippostrongylus brasiliensis]